MRVGLVAGGAEVVEAAIVVVDTILSWSLSSSALGMGNRVALSASIASPHSFRRQSVKLPLNEFFSVSRTMIVHLPTPLSPLHKVRMSRSNVTGIHTSEQHS